MTDDRRAFEAWLIGRPLYDPSLTQVDAAWDAWQAATAAALERAAENCEAAARRLSSCPDSPETQSSISTLEYRAKVIRALKDQG